MKYCVFVFMILTWYVSWWRRPDERIIMRYCSDRSRTITCFYEIIKSGKAPAHGICAAATARVPPFADQQLKNGKTPWPPCLWEALKQRSIVKENNVHDPWETCIDSCLVLQSRSLLKFPRTYIIPFHFTFLPCISARCLHQNSLHVPELPFLFPFSTHRIGDLFL